MPGVRQAHKCMRQPGLIKDALARIPGPRLFVNKILRFRAAPPFIEKSYIYNC